MCILRGGAVKFISFRTPLRDAPPKPWGPGVSSWPRSRRTPALNPREACFREQKQSGGPSSKGPPCSGGPAAPEPPLLPRLKRGLFLLRDPNLRLGKTLPGPSGVSALPGSSRRGQGSPSSQAFLCFALVFCALVQVAFWRCHNPTQVEDAVLDAYDQVYEQAVKSSSGIWRQELVAIQDMFQCCGKSPPLGLQEGSEADLCRGQEAARQDCLQGIRNVLRTHRNVASTLISLGLASMVYVMPLSAFLWFAIRSGKYTLSPRARGCQPQEPHFYRRCQEGPAPHHLSEADALRGRRGPSSRSGHPPLLQDTHLPTHRSNRDAPASARTRSFPGGDELFSSTWWWDGEGGDPTRQATSM
ncbi:tetraspanin-32 isoform X1 [Pseudorca crassidens]|uniref:tetraspanin-32 isoform X1 n=1 Tax=Pseudorca crassidens TaxID=82174 RepID=UPI00352C79D1